MPNYTRAEIKRQAVEKAANDAAIAAAAAKHAESIKPQKKIIESDWAKRGDRWLGTAGNVPQSHSEESLVDACQEQGLGYSDTRQRLLALRADMPKLKPPQVL